MLFFYTLYLKPTLSWSAFAGPQHSNTFGTGLVPVKQWAPAAGISMGWQGPRASFAASYARRVSDGGGLAGAVHSNAADASLRAQLSRNWNGALSGGYARNTLLDASALGSAGGHTVSGTVSLERYLGQHLDLQLGYTRLHQSYNNIAVIASAPDRNREWMTISYQFERPLGR